MTYPELRHKWFGGQGGQLEEQLGADKLKEIVAIIERRRGNEITGDTSDGFHTFNELYEHRLALNVALFNQWGALAKYGVHKSWKHSDGQPCFGGGWFIVMATLPSGQISYHYEAKHWGLFNVAETPTAMKYDGHTPADVVRRLTDFIPEPL